MLVKICGITNPKNAQEISALGPDFLGMIFYERSPRKVCDEVAREIARTRSAETLLLGIFVQPNLALVRSQISSIPLDGVHLYGSSAMRIGQELRSSNFDGTILATVPATAQEIKAVSDHDTTFLNFIVFETPTKDFGGSGRSFNWELLSQYEGETPFFISGGIGSHNILEVLSLKHKAFLGIDLNSRIESTAGMKDISLAAECIQEVRNAYPR